MTVTFGKYKGEPVEALIDDKSYCDWLMNQSWFEERYPEMHEHITINT